MFQPTRRLRPLHAIAVLGISMALVSCTDMYDQPRHEPLEASKFFPDGTSARPLVEGTVARGKLNENTHLFEGKVDGKLAEDFPFPIDRSVLERGRERFNIYCAPCHGPSGRGNGMIVQRGFQKPPSFHEERLQEAPVGYLYGVATNGFGAMSGYAAQVQNQDRWAIVAYIRALQLSGNASIDEIPSELRKQLEAKK